MTRPAAFTVRVPLTQLQFTVTGPQTVAKLGQCAPYLFVHFSLSAFSAYFSIPAFIFSILLIARFMHFLFFSFILFFFENLIKNLFAIVKRAESTDFIPGSCGKIALVTSKFTI